MLSNLFKLFDNRIHKKNLLVKRAFLENSKVEKKNNLFYKNLKRGVSLIDE